MAAVALNWLLHAFAYPRLLPLLALLLVLAVVALFARRQRREALAWLGGTPTLRALLVEQGVPRRLCGLCLAVGLVLLVLGSAGPQWGRDWEQPTAPGRDLVVVLDLSRSMLAESPSRLERARNGLLDLVTTVQRRGGHRLALIVFAGRARVLCPLTHDYDHFRDMLTQLDPVAPPPDLWPGPNTASGTRIGAALRLAVETHDRRFRGAQDILLLSDGDDPARDQEWRTGAEEAREDQISIHVVGIGDPNEGHRIQLKDGYQRYGDEYVQTRLEEKPLQEIARIARGTYSSAQTQPLALGELFRERIEPQPVREESEDALPLYRQRYAWLLGPALLLLALAMAVGWGMPRVSFGCARQGSAPPTLRGTPRLNAMLALALLAVVLLAAAPAADPEKLLRLGNMAFERGDYPAAVERYAAAEERSDDPGMVSFNEAAGLYRLGQYREAELHYRRCLEDASAARRAAALYGLGNSLLQQSAGRGAMVLREAIRAYEQCLGQEAVSVELADDARHNLELAKILWVKAKAVKQEQGAEPPEPEEDPMQTPPGRRDGSQSGPTEATTGTPQPGGDKDRTDPRPGEQPIRTNEWAPSKGNLPPVPDTDAMAPLTPEDAAAHLERAAERVLRERREHLHFTAKPPASSVKDW